MMFGAKKYVANFMAGPPNKGRIGEDQSSEPLGGQGGVRCRLTGQVSWFPEGKIFNSLDSKPPEMLDNMEVCFVQGTANSNALR